MSYFNNSLADPVLLNNIHFNHFLYADDLVLISETPSGLQHCVDALQSFCSKWLKLILNSEIHISDPYVIIGVINESNSFIHFSTEMKLE
jgi:hypothetical protein